jgi:citrate lyase subunit beta/citryl-CoA lyase
MTKIDTRLDLLPLRSLLSVPAINERAMAKLASLDCDGVILDFEDSVPPEKKAEARRLAIDFLGSTRLSGRLVMIRVNHVATEWFSDDMDAVIAARPDAVVIPKVNDPRDLRHVADLLDERDGADDIRLWAMMETSRAVLNAAAIAEAARAVRLDGMIVGLNDLRKETRVRPIAGRAHLQPWLMQLVLAARAYDLAILDSVHNDFRDLAGFEAECVQGEEMGFDGKMLIHPDQIEPSNRLFAPSPEAMAEAVAIIGAFEQPDAGGKAVINLGGRMIERLHLDQARRLMAKVQAIQARGKAS